MRSRLRLKTNRGAGNGNDVETEISGIDVGKMMVNLSNFQGTRQRFMESRDPPRFC